MSARSRKRSKRKAKQSQKLAWMVELRMMGHTKEDVLRLKECGNFVQAHRYYEMLLRTPPELRRQWSHNTWKVHGGNTNEFDFYQTL